jgi:hypothetical protein
VSFIAKPLWEPRKNPTLLDTVFPRNGVENSPKMAYPKIRKSETKKIRRNGMNRDGKWNRV